MAVAPRKRRESIWTVIEPAPLVLLALATLKNAYPHSARFAVIKKLGKEWLDQQVMLLSKCNMTGYAHWTAYRVHENWTEQPAWKRTKIKSDTIPDCYDHKVYRTQRFCERRCYKHY